MDAAGIDMHAMLVNDMARPDFAERFEQRQTDVPSEIYVWKFPERFRDGVYVGVPTSAPVDAVMPSCSVEPPCPQPLPPSYLVYEWAVWQKKLEREADLTREAAENAAALFDFKF